MISVFSVSLTHTNTVTVDNKDTTLITEIHKVTNIVIVISHDYYSFY